MAAGAAIDLSGVKLPFTVGDGLNAGTQVMGIFGDWTLLGVGFALAILIIGVIFWVVKKSKSAANTKS